MLNVMAFKLRLQKLSVGARSISRQYHHAGLCQIRWQIWYQHNWFKNREKTYL